MRRDQSHRQYDGDLFDDMIDAAVSTPAPNVRRTDPDTSHIAAERITAIVGTAALRMLSEIAIANASDVCLTANEAAERCVNKWGGNHETYRKRIRDIRHRLAEVDVRNCNVTGHAAQTYRVVKET